MCWCAILVSARAPIARTMVTLCAATAPISSIIPAQGILLFEPCLDQALQRTVQGQGLYTPCLALRAGWRLAPQGNNRSASTPDLRGRRSGPAAGGLCKPSSCCFSIPSMTLHSNCAPAAGQAWAKRAAVIAFAEAVGPAAAATLLLRRVAPASIPPGGCHPRSNFLRRC